jgi:hypothetical protein
MRHLVHFVCRPPLILVMATAMISTGIVGCQRPPENEDMGQIITDLSQVPGTETPYKLPDLTGDGSAPTTARDQAAHDHGDH